MTWGFVLGVAVVVVASWAILYASMVIVADLFIAAP